MNILDIKKNIITNQSLTITKTLVDEYNQKKSKVIINMELTIKEFLENNNFPLNSVVHYNNQMINRNLGQMLKDIPGIAENKAIKVAPHALDGESR